MRSDTIKQGVERAPHRSLLKGTGNFTDADIDKPFIAVANSFVDIIPGHAHLDKVGISSKTKFARLAAFPLFLTRSVSMTESRWGTSG